MMKPTIANRSPRQRLSTTSASTSAHQVRSQKLEATRRYVASKSRAAQLERCRSRPVTQATQTDDAITGLSTSLGRIVEGYRTFKANEPQNRGRMYSFVLHSPTRLLRASPPRQPDFLEPDMLSPSSRFNSCLRSTVRRPPLPDDDDGPTSPHDAVGLGLSDNDAASSTASRSVVTIEDLFVNRPDVLSEFAAMSQAERTRLQQRTFENTEAEVIVLDDDDD